MTETTCPVCDGKRFIPRVPDYQDRSDEEPCWLCNAKPLTYADLADQYDRLRAAGYSNDVAAQYVDMML